MATSAIPSVSARHTNSHRLQIEVDDQPAPRLPEQKLIASTILNALQDAYNPQRYLYCTDVDTVRARCWLDDTTSVHAFSLRWCCDELDINVDAMVRAIKRDPQAVIERLNTMTFGRKVSGTKKGVMAA